MKKAVENLSLPPDFLLIDGGRHKVDLSIMQRGISGGDRKCASIAAASIIAKVIRDRIMLRYHRRYPGYGFDRHKGYGTREHMRKILNFGPCRIHRRSFYPVSKVFAG
jgi:ribonuclease HII